MPSIVAVDASVLYASVDRSDRWHAASLELLRRSDLRLLIPILVIPEVAHLVGRRLGSSTEAAFVEGIAQMWVESPVVEDWTRIVALAREYADWPLGIVDASIVALCERLDIDAILTLDRRHFGAIRPRHRRSFELLP